MASGADDRVVLAAGAGDLVRAVHALTAAGLTRFTVIGGVAVAARLGRVHRATTDVDTVVDETSPPEAIAALLAIEGAERDPTGRHRVRIAGTQVEIIGVAPLGPGDEIGLTGRERLFVGAHAWALETATPLRLATTAGDDVVAPFATPAALVAMKLHALVDRRPGGPLEKRSGDAWDIFRILLDLDHDGGVSAELALMPSWLRSEVRATLRRTFVEEARATTAWLRAGDDRMAAISADELRLVAGPVVDVLA